jgi:segregation and condensation protein B
MSEEQQGVVAAPWVATVEDLEALLFVVDRPITRREAAKLLEASKSDLDALVTALTANLAQRGITLITHGDELQLASGAEQARAVLAWVGTGGSDLTAAPLETLAVIAYRQPVTKGGVEEIRGVDADYALRVLLERGLIEEAGRMETAGRPIRYATTLEFLRRFGLGSLADLPALEGDAEALRHMDLRSEAPDASVATGDSEGAEAESADSESDAPSTPAQEDAATD